LGFEDAAKSLAVFLVVMHFHRETSSSRKACKAREWTPATRCLFGIAELGEIAQILIFSFKAFFFFHFNMLCKK
jgi:hypothetical protein